MPDKDIFNRKFDPGWRSPARNIFYGVKKEETIPSICKALKRFIAHHPEIKRQFGEIVQILCTNDNSNLCYSNLLKYKDKFEDRTIGELIYKAAWRTYLLINISDQKNSFNEKYIEDRLANKICFEIIDYHLLSRFPYNKNMNANFDTEQLKKEFLPFLVNEINNISKSIIKGEKTKKYRKNNQTSKSVRKSTDEILLTPISSI